MFTHIQGDSHANLLHVWRRGTCGTEVDSHANSLHVWRRGTCRTESLSLCSVFSSLSESLLICFMTWTESVMLG